MISVEKDKDLCAYVPKKLVVCGCFILAPFPQFTCLLPLTDLNPCTFFASFYSFVPMHRHTTTRTHLFSSCSYVSKVSTFFPVDCPHPRSTATGHEVFHPPT